MTQQAAASASRAAALQVVLNAELEPALIDKLRAAFPTVGFSTKAELASNPSRLEQAEVLFTQLVDPKLVAAAKNLRWVQTYSAGVEWLLTDEVRARTDLVITNARGIHAAPIAEHVFGMLLALVRRIDGSIQQQQTQAWQPQPLIKSLRTLDGATLGIIGLGAIGQRLALVGKAFGMRVIGTRQSGKPTPGVDQVHGPDGLHKVLAASEYVVNALPVTPATRHAFDRAALAQLRPDAVLVNIGRGATVDTDALVEALRTGKLGGALLDVTDPEPLPKGHALWTLPNVIITPHYAGAHPGYGEHVTAIFQDNLTRYLAQRPLHNTVDTRAGY